eukprot:symbB.v1.2.001242.t1/scaffold63.1/size477159/13
MLMATSTGFISAVMIGMEVTSSLSFLITCLFFVELCICTDDLLTEALYARELQDHPQNGQSLLTYVFAGMTVWSLVANLSSGFLLESLGAHGSFLTLTPALAPALLASFLVPEVPESINALHRRRRRFWHQRHVVVCAAALLSASLLMSATAIATKDTQVNAMIALLSALLVLCAFGIFMSPVIAKFSAFTLLQSALHLSVSGPAFYFLTDSKEAFPEGPHFSVLFYNTFLGCLGSFATLLGLYTYNRYSSEISYRRILIISNITFSVFHLADVVLFSRLNVKLGIPDYLFAFGNQSLGNVIFQWLWMPQVGLFSQLCPKDMEATMFALIVSCHNLGVAVSSALGAQLCLLPLLGVTLALFLVPDTRPGDEIAPEDGTTKSLWNRWTKSSEMSSITDSDSITEMSSD